MAINFQDSYPTINWDLNKTSLYIKYFGKKDDSARGFKVQILQDADVLTPTTEKLRIYCLKQDNKKVYIDAVPSGDLFVIDLTNQVFAVAGTVDCELQLSSNGDWVTSETFYIKVNDNLEDGSILSSDDYIALRDALDSIESSIEQVNTAVSQVNMALTDTETAIANVETATTNANNAATNANNVATQLTNETLIIWKPYVATYDNIASTYPTPVLGWATQCQDTGIRWRYNGTTWANIGVEPVDKVGDLTQLPTTDKSNTVNAIKEVSGQLAAIVEQQDVLQATLSQDYKSIFSTGTGKDSTNADQDFNNKAEGQSSIKIEGLTLLNMITYNTDTWAEWTKDSGIVGDSSGLEFTANGTGYIYGRYTSKFKNGTKYGMLLNSVNNNLTTQILLENYITDTSVPIVNPGVVGNVKTVFTTKSSISINKLSLYISSGTLGTKGKIRDIRVFELPAGSQIETDFNTLTANELSLKYPYINGIQGVGSYKTVSVGKNRFDKITTVDKIIAQATSTYASRVVEEGFNCFKLTGNNNYVGKLLGMKFEPNTRYVAKFTGKNNGTQGGTFGFKYTDGTTSSISATLSNTFAEYTAISTVGKSIEDIYISYNNTGANYYKLDDFQIVKGDVPLDIFEPYQSAELNVTLPRPLHRVPNVVTDVLETVNSVPQVTYNNNSYIIQSSDITLEVGTNTDKALVHLPADCYNVALSASPVKLLFEKFPFGTTASVDADNVNYIGMWCGYDSGNRIIQIPFTKGTTLATMQSTIANSKVIYKLANPVVYKNGENGFSVTGNLEVFKDGTIYVEPTTLKECTNPKTYITYNLSQKAIITENSGELTEIQKFLQGRVIIESGSNANGNYVKFADGTMICHNIITLSNLPITTALGSLYNTDNLTWTFPSTFIDTNTKIFGGLVGSNIIGFITDLGTQNTLVTYRIVNPTSQTPSTIKIKLCAIGRWK